MKTELILLAAGQSKRFGGIKQLTDIHGQAMVCHCLAQYRQGDKWTDGIVNGHVMLGANAAVIIDVLPQYIDKHVLNTWQHGMGHTLAQSIQVIAGDTTHLLIGLADQVSITQKMIISMLGESKKHPQNIIAARYAGRVGVPCIFPRQYFSQLSQLTGDKGAKTLLSKYPEQVINMDMPEAAFDIDTLEDLKLV
ncbi:MAG: nucleotidyltransferase family protein [Paraglaciecola sp.]|nr:nucleotidyltransferase family protein [Paraglaciecola sp.]